jgi:hypothetical protein
LREQLLFYRQQPETKHLQLAQGTVVIDDELLNGGRGASFGVIELINRLHYLFCTSLIY